MYTILNEKEKSFIIMYNNKKKTTDKHHVEMYRIACIAGDVKVADFHFLATVFPSVSLFHQDIDSLCSLINKKTLNYKDAQITLSIKVTGNHTFKFEIMHASEKPTRVAISLSEEEYNRLINLHAIADNKSISTTLKNIYLQGLEPFTSSAIDKRLKTYKDGFQIQKAKLVKIEKSQKSTMVPSADVSIKYEDIKTLNSSELIQLLSSPDTSRYPTRNIPVKVYNKSKKDVAKNVVSKSEDKVY